MARSTVGTHRKAFLHALFSKPLLRWWWRYQASRKQNTKLRNKVWFSASTFQNLFLSFVQKREFIQYLATSNPGQAQERAIPPAARTTNTKEVQFCLACVICVPDLNRETSSREKCTNIHKQTRLSETFLQILPRIPFLITLYMHVYLYTSSPPIISS